MKFSSSFLSILAAGLAFGCVALAEVNQPVLKGAASNLRHRKLTCHNESPVAKCQEAPTIDVGSSKSPITLTGAEIDGGSTDNCGDDPTLGAYTEWQPEPKSAEFNCGHLDCDESWTSCSPKEHNVLLVVTNNVGNIATCQSTVTVEDVTDPVPECINKTVSLYDDGDGVMTASIIPQNVSGSGTYDNCGVSLGELGQETFTCGDIGDVEVTLTVYDASGNSGSCTVTVTVEDHTPPDVTCHDDPNPSVTLANEGGSWVASANPDELAFATDLCAPPQPHPTLAFQEGSDGSFTCADVKNGKDVGIKATDASGNVGTCTAHVTVVDAEHPVATCVGGPVIKALNNEGKAVVVADDLDNGSNDNCGYVGKATNAPAGGFTCAQKGDHTVTLTVVDNSENTDTCDVTVTVVDSSDPIAICKASFNAPLDVNGEFTLGTSHINNGSSDNCPGLVLSMTAADTAPFTCDDLGETARTVTLTATDAGGLTNTCTTAVSAVDQMPPTVTCASSTVELNANGAGSITTDNIKNTASDNCYQDLTFVASKTSFSCNDLNLANSGANTVTLTATDGSNNDGTCQATVTVLDVTDPVARCQDITVELNATGSVSIVAGDIDDIETPSNDNCHPEGASNVAGGRLGLSANQTLFSCNHLGPNTVTLTAADDSSNEATCEAVVTVEDNINPIARCKDVTARLESNGQFSLSAGNVDDGSSDNCQVATLTIPSTTYDCDDLGKTYTVTMTATDTSLNTAQCTSRVTISTDFVPSTCNARWYADWTGTDTCVLNGDYPAYMATNPTNFLHPTQSECCNSHYSWEYNTCMGTSSGSGSLTESDAGSGKWYIKDGTYKCVRDCVSGTKCGGLAEKYWEEMFDTQEKCCEQSWVFWNYASCMA